MTRRRPTSPWTSTCRWDRRVSPAQRGPRASWGPRATPDAPATRALRAPAVPAGRTAWAETRGPRVPMAARAPPVGWATWGPPGRWVFLALREEMASAAPRDALGSMAAPGPTETVELREPGALRAPLAEGRAPPAPPAPRASGETRALVGIAARLATREQTDATGPRERRDPAGTAGLRARGAMGSAPPTAGRPRSSMRAESAGEMRASAPAATPAAPPMPSEIPTTARLTAWPSTTRSRASLSWRGT
mmetsp:Transcript_23242/g.45103  ORF Transcript_23242/g.45103 Transcript_23242/m.45103 type:complete len:249 (+) Transcript_23242:550-1296(+)